MRFIDIFITVGIGILIIIMIIIILALLSDQMMQVPINVVNVTN